MVASLIAGQGHDGDAGIIGVAPSARLLSVSVGFGVGTVGSDDQIANAVRWSVDHGADIINMSLTRNTLEWPESWDDAFLYAMQHDVVIVAAAGNRGSGTTEVGAPATMPGVLTVAGVDQNGKASFDASSQGITISVAAPSEDLVGAAPGGGYYNWAGTSGATPIVAGMVALVRSAYPELDAANVINRVIATAKPVGGQVPEPDLRVRTHRRRRRRHRAGEPGHREPDGRSEGMDPRLPACGLDTAATVRSRRSAAAPATPLRCRRPGPHNPLGTILPTDRVAARHRHPAARLRGVRHASRVTGARILPQNQAPPGQVVD